MVSEPPDISFTRFTYEFAFSRKIPPPHAACILSVVPWPPAIAGAASVLAPTTAEPRKKLRRFSELVIISSQ